MAFSSVKDLEKFSMSFRYNAIRNEDDFFFLKDTIPTKQIFGKIVITGM